MRRSEEGQVVMINSRLARRGAGAILLVLFPISLGWAQEPTEPDDLGEYIAWTVPAVAVNTIPGFGLGSLGHGDPAGFRRGLLLDVVGVGLIAGSAAVLNSRPAGEPAGAEAISLLAGYGVYASARVLGVVRPLRWARNEGIGDERAFAPIVYNTLPGFGVGSRLQDDRPGATTLAVADLTTFTMVGVLSFAALAGQETPAAIAGVTAISTFAFARVYGVVRPAIIARRRAGGRGRR